jgi:hypothetical protein
MSFHLISFYIQLYNNPSLTSIFLTLPSVFANSPLNRFVAELPFSEILHS